jgi:phage-related protein
MAEILEVEIIAKLDKIQAGLDQIDKKAQGAGKSAGSSFGNAFVSVANSILATISFNAVLGGINSAVGAYRNLNTVQTSLQTSIEGINRNTANNTAILKDNNATLEQKARALGLNIENYEKTAKATGGASTASKSYKIDLKNEEDALKSKEEANKKDIDSTKKIIDTKKESIDSIEKNIKSIEKERDAKLENAGATDKIIKAENERIRQAESQLNKEAKAINQKYEAQYGAREIGIKQELFAQQTTMNGLKTQERALNDNAVANKAQLEALGKQKDAVNNKIDALRQEQEQININRDTELAQLELKQLAVKQQLESDKEKLDSVKSTNESIKASHQDQVNEQKDQIQSVKDEITLLQKTIEDKQAKFDIDTEPAKQKIEELKSQIQNISLTSSGGGGAGAKVIDRAKLEKDVNAGVAKQGNAKEISGKDVGEKVKKMYEKFQGTVSEATLSSAFTNVFQGGIKDAEQANKLIEQYVDSAANGKSASISLDQAVSNLSETFKTGSSSLGNLSGITQNYSAIDKEGLEIMKARGETSAKTVDDLTDQERAVARLEGTMKTENIAQGTFVKLSKSGAFEQDKFNAELLKTQQAIGKDLTPAFNNVLKELTPIIKGFTDFVTQNPQVVTAIAGIALGLTGLLTAVTVVTAVISVITTLGTVFAGLGAVITVIGTTIGLFFGGLVAVVTSPVTLVIGAIALLIGAVAGLVWAWNNNFMGIQDITKNFWESVKKFFSDGWEWVSKGVSKWWTDLSKWFSDGVAKNTKIIKDFLDGIRKWFSDAWVGITKGLSEWWEGVKKFFNDGKKGLDEAVTNTLSGLKGIFETAFNGIKGVVDPIIKGIQDAIQKVSDMAKEALGFVQQLFGGSGEAQIKQSSEKVKQMIEEIKNASANDPTGQLPDTKQRVQAIVDRYKSQGYAMGGIVGGNSYSGDKIPAFVNSGEMILNQAQQARLFSMANGGNINNSKQITINQSNNIQGQVGLQSANSQLAFLITNNI